MSENRGKKWGPTGHVAIHSEVLISLVEAREAIWNIRSADYQNSILRQAQWLEILRELNLEEDLCK